MDLLHLKYFLTVAKLEHMTNAAKELNIVQPALSKTISSLEKELGVSLFDRRGKYIKLNENGKFFYDKVNSSLSILDSSIKELQERNFVLDKEIRLLVLAASPLIPEIITEFRKIHPEIIFEISQSLENINSVKEYDLCIYSDEPNCKLDENSTSLFEEELVLAVSKGHPLASKGSISLNDISGENFVCLNNGHLKELTQNICQKSGFSASVLFEFNNPFTLRNIIASNQGIAIVPRTSWLLNSDDLVTLLHLEPTNPTRTVNLTLYKSTYKSKHILLFKDFLIDYFNKLK